MSAIESLNDLFAEVTQHAPAPTNNSKSVVAAASMEEMQKVLPELVLSLVQPNGEAWPGATAYHNPNIVGADGIDTGVGQFGPAGALYVTRPNVVVTPAIAAFILETFGHANRESTKSRLDKYTDAMKSGDWSYVGNTAIFTVPLAGQTTCIGLEQHNCAHTMKSIIASGRPALVTFILGIPKSERDKIDDNQQRTAKDIVTTRSEMREMFKPDQVIGGVVNVTKAMANSMMRQVAESFRIVVDVRNGKDAKSPGSRDKTETGKLLDVYSRVLGNAVSQTIALDSKLETTSVAKDGTIKKKLSGGLTKRYAVNHLAAALTLGASYVRKDGSFGWDDATAVKILRCYAQLGNESLTDVSNPMVSLQKAVDVWDAEKKHKGADGMNVRFSALKLALTLALTGRKMTDQSFWNSIVASTGRKCQLKDLGKNPESIDGTVGIDNWVDPSDKALAEANAAKAEAGGTLASAVAEVD